jgi:transposase
MDEGDTRRGEAHALRQIRESAQKLLSQGKSGEAWELLFSALEAVLAKNRDQELLIAKLRRERIGQKSERLDPAQMQLLFEAMAALPVQEAPVAVEEEQREDAKLDREIEAAEHARPKEPGKKRKAGAGWKSSNVEQQVHRVEVGAADRKCAKCGCEMKPLTGDVTRRLEFVPGHFVEHEYHLETLACGTCKEGVTTAPAPPQVLDRSAAGASVLSDLIVGKFVNHTPLHRKNRGYAQLGVDIPVSTLSDWVAGVGDLVQPLVDRLAKRVLRSTILRTDATGLLVLDPDSPDNVVRGSMWCYVGDDRDVVFRYTQTGEGETGPWTFLAGREGYIQADASNVFDRLFNGQVAKAVELGCWSHARRKLFALEDTDCRVAYPLKLIGRLYRVEHLADARELAPKSRAKLRKERSSPILEKLRRWFTATVASEPPSADLAKAAAYSLNHWIALTRFVEDGRISPDNNLCEQQMRDIAQGRKNYLFAGSHDAARRAAALYSLTRTCIQHRVPPQPYFTDVLGKLATGCTEAQMDKLLPHCWRPPSHPWSRRTLTAEA